MFVYFNVRLFGRYKTLGKDILECLNESSILSDSVRTIVPRSRFVRLPIGSENLYRTGRGPVPIERNRAKMIVTREEAHAGYAYRGTFLVVLKVRRRSGYPVRYEYTRYILWRR